MIELGLITDDNTVSFDCILPGPPERVWLHLTRRELLRAWLADGEIEPRPGGSVKLRFESGEAPVRSGAGALIRGLVSHYEPCRKLAYSWIDTSRDRNTSRSLYFGSAVTVVCFDLGERDGHVTLKLTHRRLSMDILSKAGAGWHAHLGMLHARLYSEEPEPLLPRFHGLLSRYERQVSMLRPTGVRA